MKQVGGIARHALDELPLNVAILASDGEIVDTNLAWRRFGNHTGRDAGDVGENYFAAASDDDEAVAGIREVLSGERDVYACEYPCHSSTERRWFEMRVTRFDRDGTTYAVVAHLDVTERKLAELETEHVLDRVDGLVTGVTTALVAATTRAEIEAGLVDAAVATDTYDAAVVARVDHVTDELGVTAASDSAPAVGPWRAAGDSLVARAFGAQEVRASPPAKPDAVGGRTAARRDAGYESFAAVPFATADTTYGVLVLYTRDTGVFDARERRLLRALGYTAGTAIRAMENARALVATSLVEVELTTGSDDLFFTRLSRELDCSLRYRGSLPGDDDGPLVFFEVAHDDPSAVVEWSTEHPNVAAAAVLWAHDDDALLEFRLRNASVATGLADLGVDTRDVTVEEGVARFTLAFPADRDAREVVSMLESDHPDVELVAFRETERPQRTPRGAWAALADELTPRQTTALTKAHVSGFFDWPHVVTGSELADSMGITRATFHQHLRAAERKLVAAYFDDPN